MISKILSSKTSRGNSKLNLFTQFLVNEINSLVWFLQRGKKGNSQPQNINFETELWNSGISEAERMCLLWDKIFISPLKCLTISGLVLSLAIIAVNATVSFSEILTDLRLKLVHNSKGNCLLTAFALSNTSLIHCLEADRICRFVTKLEFQSRVCSCFASYMLS